MKNYVKKDASKRIQKYNYFLRIYFALNRLFFDIIYLFYPKRIFIYSWMKFKGNAILNNNWGDDINKYFFEDISRCKVRCINHSMLFKIIKVRSYSCIGSIIGYFNAKHYEVWGSGLIERNKRIRYLPDKIHSVRGPLTREELLKKGVSCPEQYGDPALLISRYYRKLVDKTYAWGIIPHYSDENNPVLQEFLESHSDVILISMRNYDDWHEIMEKILSCNRVISSSLHGLIMADSYGVRNCWVKFSDNMRDDDFKFHDYLMSVNRRIDKPYVIKNLNDFDAVILNDKTSLASNIDYRSIFESCPFKEKLVDYNSITPTLPFYTSPSDKSDIFAQNIFIRNVAELEKYLTDIESCQEHFLFRGMCDSSYKMYSSLQRNWIQVSDLILSLGTTNYAEAIKKIEYNSRKSEVFRYYFENNNIAPNRMLLSSFLLNNGMLSHAISFTCSLKRAVSFAIKDAGDVTEGKNNLLSEYFSIYFFPIRFINETKDNFKDTFLCIYQLSSKSSKEGFELKLMSPHLYNFQEGIFLNGIVFGKFMSDDSMFSKDDLFVLNNDSDRPFAELLYREFHSMPIGCLNIHKKLIPYIKKRFVI